MWDDEGEFRFRSVITTGGEAHEIEFPEQGLLVDLRPPAPEQGRQDRQGSVRGSSRCSDLVVELFGVELDKFTASRPSR